MTQRRTIWTLAVTGLLCVTAWFVHRRWVSFACPWLLSAMPRVRLALNGTSLDGLDRIHNTGNAPALHVQFGSYLLIVPSGDPEHDVYRRILYSDRAAKLQDLQSLPAHSSSLVSLDLQQMGAASVDVGPAVSFLDADHYLRLLLSYRDAHGHLHRTFRCYQIAERQHRLLSVWSCPAEDLSD